MTLIALAAAQMLADDVDAWGMPRLRAVLPVAGMTLIEQQAERARSVGVTKLLLLVDGVPPALAEACDRIRARGLPVELVRDGAGVVRGGAGAERVLLVADGLIAGVQAWQAMAGARGAALLATDDAHVTQAMERIDASTRWAGLAALPADAMTRIADAPDGWDPQLMMLRKAVQDGAPRVAWDQALFVSGDIALATSAGAAAEVEQRLMAATEARERGIGRRWLVAPLARTAAGPLLAAQWSGRVARLASFIAATGAIAAVLAGQLLPGLGLGLLAAFSHGTGDFVARFRPEGRLWRALAQIGIGTQLVALFLAERGAEADSLAALTGNGSFGACVVVALSEAVRRREGQGPLVDLPAAWLALGVLVTALGPVAAALAVGLVGLALHIGAILGPSINRPALNAV
jgi:hypothetical protein